MKELFILSSRSVGLAFSLVSLGEMIVHQRIIRIDAQDAFVFGDSFVELVQLKVSIG